MKTRLKQRRERIVNEIRFILEVVYAGEWVSNKDILINLHSKSRGKQSYNSINQSTLGQYMRAIPNEKRITDVDKGKAVEYRILTDFDGV